MLHGWLPVKAMLICFEPPLQIDPAVVLITDVGRGLTVIGTVADTAVLQVPVPLLV